MSWKDKIRAKDSQLDPEDKISSQERVMREIFDRVMEGGGTNSIISDISRTFIIPDEKQLRDIIQNMVDARMKLRKDIESLDLRLKGD